MKFFSIFFKNFEEILAGIFTIVMVAVVVVNIVLRYFFGFIIEWSEEVSVISFVWASFLGASACYKHSLHIGVDFFIQSLPDIGKKILKITTTLFLMVLSITMFVLSTVYVIRSKKTTPIMGISYIYINMSMMVSFFLITIHSIRFLIQNIRIKKNHDVDKENLTTALKEVYTQ